MWQDPTQPCECTHKYSSDAVSHRWDSFSRSGLVDRESGQRHPPPAPVNPWNEAEEESQERMIEDVFNEDQDMDDNQGDSQLRGLRFLFKFL